MTDFESLRNIFEMSEFLEFEDDDSLEIVTIDERSGQTATITFNFNDEGELIQVFVQE